MSRIVIFAVALGFMALAGLIVSLTASAFAAAQERTVLYQHLADALDPVADAAAHVEWEPAVRNLVRDFEDFDEHLVGKALTSAWRSHAAAMETGETVALADYFSGVALSRAIRSATDGNAAGTQMVVLDHTARPAFFHLDGSVLQVEAQALTVRYATQGDRLDFFQISRDEVVTTLMNETTGWRIFSHERTGSENFVTDAGAIPPDMPMAGINYYPARTPWRRFWPEFDAAVIDADMKLMRTLNANTVRFFLPVDVFTEPKTRTEMLARLETFLSLAEQNGLKLVPTLFDMKPGYSPALWSDDAGYLGTVLPVLAASDAVVLIDLKNEPDLDMAAHGQAQVEAWLRTMAALTRDLAPGLPLTIGWSSAQAATVLTDIQDVISYHDYAEGQGLVDRLALVRQAAEGKPVLLTEIGASSYTLAAGFPGSVASQADRLGQRLEDLRTADGVFVWTLHDFPEPDKIAVGSSPWVVRLQSGFGLFDAFGDIKPAGEVVTEVFDRMSRTQ